MAIKIFDKFSPRANAPSANYPVGSIKNESVPGVGDGTPLDAEWGNDYAGFDAALLAEAEIEASGNPDTAIASQRLDAMKALFQDHSKQTNRDEQGAHPASAIVGVSEMRNEIISGVIFPEEPEKELQVGDSIPAGVTHVRVQGAIKPLTPQLSGVVNSIGDRSLDVDGEAAYHFVVRGGILFYDESGGKMDATLDQEFWDAAAQYARDTGVKIKLGNGQLLLNRFRVNNNVVIGSFATEILLQYNSSVTAVMGQIQSNSRLKGLTIKSLEPDLEWQRCTFENSEDVTCEWVNFVGFRHVSSMPNAWGAYFSNSKRCTLIDCGFDDNTQSDFAIVDNNEFISIIRPRRLGSKLVGNIEPNALSPNVQIKVSGAKLSTMYLQANTRIGDPMSRILLENCEIDLLYYDGADVTLMNTFISEWKEARTATNKIFAGNIDVVGGNFSFSRNLIQDKNFAIAAAGQSNAEWVVQFSTATPQNRLALLNNNHERGLILNPSASNVQTVLTTLNNIEVTPSKTYIIGLTAKVDTGSAWIGGYLQVREFDSDGQFLRETGIFTHRELTQVTKDATTNFAVFNTLAQTSSVKVQVSNSDDGTSTNKLTLIAISLNRIGKGDVDFSGIKNEHVPVSNVVVRGASEYKTNFNYRVPMLVGDEVYVGPERYICTDDSVYSGDHWIGGWEKYSRVVA